MTATTATKAAAAATTTAMTTTTTKNGLVTKPFDSVLYQLPRRATNGKGQLLLDCKRSCRNCLRKAG
eukprot:3809229-Karenia_brevis.AAC.1